MRRRFPAFAVLVLPALLSFDAAIAGAQEVGVLAVRSSSANVEFPDAGGFGAFARWDVGSWLVGLSYLRYSDDTAKEGIVCEVYSPRIGCRTEGVSTSARMGGLRATVQRTLELGDYVEVGAGGGVSFNSLAVTSLGESGFRADLHLPNTGQIGYLGAASVALSPVPSAPVRLVASFSRHWVKFKGCVDPTDPTSGYAPFCGWDHFTEVQAGVSIRLPKQ